MRLAIKRRTVVALLLAALAGSVIIVILVYLVYQVTGFFTSGYVSCASGTPLGLLSLFSGCGEVGTGSMVIVGIELLVVAAVGAVIAWSLTRWITAPVRAITEQLDRFGPNSLGLRINADGPRADAARRLGDAVDAMLDRVSEGYEAQRRFAANASHELRTPLATQRALIEISLGSALTQEQLELVTRQLLATNQRNENLIEGLLVLAETEHGLVQHGPRRLDAIVIETAESLRPSAEKRGLALRVATEPCTVRGEAPLLERLVTNLVQNAVKYNVADGWIDVRVWANGALEVANSGPQVAPESVAGLFEPFRRAKGDRLDHGGGVGLGLTIARSVVSAHGGSIEAAANPDGGLRMIVRLPLA